MQTKASVANNLLSGTTNNGASTTLSFTGDVVQVFGTCGPQNGPYQVQLDGGSPVSFNATKAANFEQVLIYYADNLGPGKHTVKFINQPASSGQSLNIDYALVESVPSVKAGKAGKTYVLLYFLCCQY